MSDADKINQLYKLFQKGHISKSEFEIEKSKILGLNSLSVDPVRNNNNLNLKKNDDIYSTFISIKLELINYIEKLSFKKRMIIGAIILFLIISIVLPTTEKSNNNLNEKNMSEQSKNVNLSETIERKKNSKCKENLTLINGLCWETVVQARNLNSGRSWCEQKSMRLPTTEELLKSSKHKKLMYPDDLAYFSSNGYVVDMSLGFSGNGDITEAYNIRCVKDLDLEDEIDKNFNEKSSDYNYLSESVNLDIGFRSDNLNGSEGQIKYLSSLISKYPKNGIISFKYNSPYGSKFIEYSRFDKTIIRRTHDKSGYSTNEKWSNVDDSNIHKSAKEGTYPNNGTYEMK